MSAIHGGDKIRTVIPGQHRRPNTPILYTLGKKNEQERIIELIKKEFGDEYYEMGVSGIIVRLIKGDN